MKEGCDLPDSRADADDDRNIGKDLDFQDGHNNFNDNVDKDRE